MRPQIIDQAAVRVEFHLQVLGAVFVAVALRDPDRVEKLGFPVIIDVRLGQFPVVFEVFVLPNVPDQTGRLAVTAGGLRNERGLHPVEELLRRARVPVAHRAEVLGVHQVTLKSVRQNLFAQLAAELERPEKRPIVVPAHRFRKGFRGVRVVHDVGERFLENVVHPDAEHEDVEALFHEPVDFLLPVVKGPVLRLEPVEAPVSEVALAAVLEPGGFQHVEARNVDRLPLRNHVTVPEPVAAGAVFEEGVNGVKRGTAAAAGQYQVRAPAVLDREDPVIIRGGPHDEVGDGLPLDQLTDERVHRVGTDDQVRVGIVRFARDLKRLTRHGGPVFLKLCGGDGVRFRLALRRSEDLQFTGLNQRGGEKEHEKEGEDGLFHGRGLNFKSLGVF